LNQVYLPVVGQFGHSLGLIPVLDEASGVCVALDPMSFDEHHAQSVGLPESVTAVAIDCDNCAVHSG
jgi:hypothetical protein